MKQLTNTAKKRMAPRIKMRGKEMALDHKDPAVGTLHLIQSLGTNSSDFACSVLAQLANAVSTGKEADAEAMNFALAVIAGIEPQDELETMLAMQMAAIHLATMTFSRRLAHVETLAQQDSAERALNKLTRTFTAQLEALKRYRTGGEQKVVVQHVNVNEGGQAIVGAIEQGKGRGEG